MPAPDNYLKITIPYTTALSKNLLRVGRGRVYRLSAPEKDAICYQLRGERNRLKQSWENVKTYVDIMVYRPDMRCDPANFVDVILDAVQAAIGVDDRWYAGSWDWLIDKENPHIVVEVRQALEK